MIPTRPFGEDADFDVAPGLVIWEMTQACDLACRHCRAEAVPTRHSLELSTDEAKTLLADVRRFGQPLLILTGGEPAKRSDLVELVAYGSELGLRVALTPSGTPLVTRHLLEALHGAGLQRLALSIDGPTRQIHDGFRGVAGSWDLTLEILRRARRLGLSTQVNTTMAPHNFDHLEVMADLVAELDIDLWSVFFVVPTGRATAADVGSAEEFERSFDRLHAIAVSAPFAVKTTAAPHYRRYALQKAAAKGRASPSRPPANPAAAPAGIARSSRAKVRGIGDGDGLVFVSHKGAIYPSGFLPVPAGNVLSWSSVKWTVGSCRL